MVSAGTHRRTDDGRAPWTQRWSLIGIVAAGLILLISARFIQRSAFFQIPRETEIRPRRRTRRPA